MGKIVAVARLWLAVTAVALSSPALINGLVTSRSVLHRLSSSSSALTRKELWFNQTLDHFSPDNHDKFEQRYYEFLDYFRMPDGPIFLKICGEGACNGISNDYLSVLAKKFGAAIVSLEHRYYGKSSPFKSLTTNNLRYLSSKQALFDLAVFRQSYQDSLNLKMNKKGENPWFVFGISYPGALSAWFRLKFPHLTCGSLASSAVVLAVYNFTEFDQQIGESAGPECKAALQEINRLVEQKFATNKKEVKALFGAAELEIDGDFFYFLADAAAIAFQYGTPDILCSPLVEAKNAGNDLVFDRVRKEDLDGWFSDSSQPFNVNSDHPSIVKAVLCAGLYPNIAAGEDGITEAALSSLERSSGSATTARPVLYDGRREVYIHPSSINSNLKAFQYPFHAFLEKVETNKVFIRDTTVVSPYSILLFGGSINIQHQSGIVVIDGWLKLTAPAQIAVLFKELRLTLHSILKDLIRRPETSIIVNNEVLKSIVRLLLEEDKPHS